MLNLPLIGLWVQLLRVPYGLLFPLILLFCVIGVRSEAGHPPYLFVLVAFGGLGYLMRKLDYEPAPLVLAFVLGWLAEESIRQSLLLSRSSLAILVDRPITAVLLVVTRAIIVVPLALPPLRRALRAVGVEFDGRVMPPALERPGSRRRLAFGDRDAAEAVRRS